jgi:hypothetical protein
MNLGGYVVHGPCLLWDWRILIPYITANLEVAICYWTIPWSPYQMRKQIPVTLRDFRTPSLFNVHPNLRHDSSDGFGGAVRGELMASGGRASGSQRRFDDGRVVLAGPADCSRVTAEGIAGKATIRRWSQTL